MPRSNLIAIDIGNARIKLGCFAASCALAPSALFPEPESTLTLSSDAPQWTELVQWLGPMRRAPGVSPGIRDAATQRHPRADAQGSPDATGVSPGFSWWIGSVNRPAASRLLDWLRSQRPQDRVTLLAAGDLPLRVAVPRPDMVGVDRLLDAVAANRLRDAGRPAVVVDVGTAITVDALSANGVFLGGAILPGIGMSARALNEFTDLLPLIDVGQVANLPENPRQIGNLPHGDLTVPPPPVGRDTEAAMRSGLFWGAVGAIRELVARAADDAGAQPQVFLTGGAGPAVADLLGPDAHQVPHLTLAGIVLTAARG
jgi:type III pantothenate kinase